MPKPKKPTFEESIQQIDVEIAKRKSKWSLHSLGWLDWDDVSQIIRIHIHKKWHLYKNEKPLAPWLNVIITHQIRNLIRNNYSNFARPCLKCEAAEGEDGCSLYSKQCSSCPLYAEWEKKKKSAYNIKIPVSMENHSNEVLEVHDDSFDTEGSALKIHEKVESFLKPTEYKAYVKLFIEGKTEEQTASELGFSTSESGRYPGYKQIKNIRNSIIAKIKTQIADGHIDI